MKYSSIYKIRIARSLALASALFLGITGLAYAHEDTPDQDAAAQRPAIPNTGNDGRDSSISRENTVRRKDPRQGSSADGDNRTLERLNQDRGADNRSTDRPNQDWGADRSGSHDGGH
jgi:hypothetical protein